MNTGPGKKSIEIKEWYCWGIITAAVYLVYCKTLSFGYVQLDDYGMIVGNQHLFGAFSGIRHIFSQALLPGVFDFFRPVLALSFIVDAQFGGTAPAVYHLTNGVLHTAACCLFYVFLRKLGHGAGRALPFALLFSVHPALVQAVAWIPGRNDTLLAVFVLSAFIFLIDFVETKKIVYCVLHSGALLLALLTKENAIVLVALLPFFLLFIRRRFARDEMLPLISGWTGSVLLWALLRTAALGTAKSFAAQEYVLEVAKSLPALLGYIGKVFIPAALSVTPSLEEMPFLPGLGGIAVLVIAAVRSEQGRRRHLFFGCAWFIAFLVPSLVSKGLHHIFWEHRLYVPAMGIFIGVAGVFPAVPERRRKLIIHAAMAGCIVLFSALSFRRSDLFMNRIVFWENAVATAPRSAAVHNRLAGIYEEIPGKVPAAETEYLRSIALDPGNKDYHRDLGVYYYRLQRYEQAEKEFFSVLQLGPAIYQDYVNLGSACERLGKRQEAVAWRQKAAELRSNLIFIAEKNKIDKNLQ